MEQTRLSGQERPLLKYAISKLNPDIFSHPVWVRFGRQGVTHAATIAEELSSAVEYLEQDDTSSTCQILLVCAVYQNIAGQNELALATLDRILDLAERAEFDSGAIWGHWGACAVSFQMERYDRAVHHLEALEAVLSKEKEWMLADFVNVIRQSLCQPEMASTRRQTDQFIRESSSDLLRSTCLWLQDWGVCFQAPGTDRLPKWDRWHAADFLHKWEMKLNGYPNGQKQFSIWQSVLSLLRLQEYHSKPAPQAGEDIQHRAAEIIPKEIPPEKGLEPGIDISTSKINSPKPKITPKRKSGSHKKQERISLTVQMLGPFSMTIEDTSLKLPVSRALSVFKYLLLHHKQDTPREVLMDIFWPDAGPESARNSLNVAMHNLRQALSSVTKIPVICFEEGAYHLASNLDVWLDVEEFDRCIKEGKLLEAKNQLTLAVAEYEIAINLYRGDLLSESPYEEWLVFERERLRVAYLDTLDHLSKIYFSEKRYVACVTLCQIILNRDNCREDVHCRLMRCFGRLGQVSLALRQYQICAEALHTELDVVPASETTQLYQQLRHHKDV
jgi:DNA-binding SARP family transcriptional activator